jgi:hypothetical protein
MNDRDQPGGEAESGDREIHLHLNFSPDQLAAIPQRSTEEK